MKRIVLDCEKLLHRREAHEYLYEALGLPEYYGRNLDALSDCLSEMSDTEIVLQEGELLRKTAGYGRRILTVFEDSAARNPTLSLNFTDEE